LVAVGFALCGAVEVSSSVALLANQKDNHAIIDTSWHCDMLVNITSRNRTEDFEVILMEVGTSPADIPTRSFGNIIFSVSLGRLRNSR